MTSLVLQPGEVRLLTQDEVAALIGMSVEWVRRNARAIPGVIALGGQQRPKYWFNATALGQIGVLAAQSANPTTNQNATPSAALESSDEMAFQKGTR